MKNKTGWMKWRFLWLGTAAVLTARSEERRVGKEC